MLMNEKKLFLLDAYALIYRAYYARIRAPRVTSDGRNTSAIFGFCNALDDIMRKEDPQYMAVCFDPPHGITFRHEAYPEYKAQRDKQPEDITAAIPYIKKIIEAYGIRVIEVEGYEADDVIGTLANEAAKEGFTTYMMTPDKDYGQLVTDNVFMYRPALKGQGFEVRGPREVCERYGIDNPRQVIDLLALEGDVSDNVPGCPGVGEKTAAKLIAEFGSVENMLANASKIKGKLGERIAENAKQIEFSKFLVTIKTDVPLDGVTPDSLRRREPDYAELRKLFTDLEFRSFLNRLTPEAESAAPAPPAVVAKHADDGPGLFDIADDVETTTPNGTADVFAVADITIAADAAEVARFAGQCRGNIAVSVYALGDEAMTAELQGMAISDQDGHVLYVDAAMMEAATEGLQVLFNSTGVLIASHDVKRDMLLLRRLGIDWQAPYFDTRVAYYLLKPEMTNALPEVAMAILNIRLADYSLSATERRRPIAGTPAQVAATVSARAEAVRLMVTPMRDMVAYDSLTPLLDEVETPLVRVLADMEWAGVRIDTAVLAAMSAKMTARMNELEKKCWEMAGGSFNVGSPSQVGEVLFGRLKIDPKAKRTKTGAWSTTEEILEKHRRQWPIVDLILQIRGLRKLLATYVDALPKLVNLRTGKIHTTFNQTVTATGRLSSTNPNLQNIPIRTDEGRLIREAFIADDGCVLLSADYSQIELRLMAAMSGDPAMVEAFNSGADIHRATAAKIYHKALDEVTDNERRHAKTANFGIIYGISAFGLSERLGISRAEAKALIEGYLLTYPEVQNYMNNAIADARNQGYVQTVMGRKRYLPEINSRNAVVRGYAERNAINAPLQGSAADIIKVAMVRIAREIAERNLRTRMILQVHDELIFNVPADELADVQEMVTRQMENAWHGAVPLTVSAGAAQNWLEAH